MSHAPNRAPDYCGCKCLHISFLLLTLSRSHAFTPMLSRSHALTLVLSHSRALTLVLSHSDANCRHPTGAFSFPRIQTIDTHSHIHSSLLLSLSFSQASPPSPRSHTHTRSLSAHPHIRLHNRLRLEIPMVCGLTCKADTGQRLYLLNIKVTRNPQDRVTDQRETRLGLGGLLVRAHIDLYQTINMHHSTSSPPLLGADIR